MNVNTSDCHITTSLAFQEPSDQRLTLQNVTLLLLQTDNTPSEVHLCIQVSPEVYHHIDTEALFNLKPEIRGTFTGGDFLPDTHYQLDVTLQPELLSSLLENAITADEAAAYLLSLSQQSLRDQLTTSPSEPVVTPSLADQNGASSPLESTDTVNPLLHTESWLCLSVKQQQGAAETGFDTFWSYVNPTVLQQAATSGEQLVAGIAKFFREWAETNLSETIQETTDELIEEIVGAFQGLTDDLSTIDWGSIDGELFDTVVSFFEDNGWPVAQVEGETSLQLAFQGDNGQWACYAGTNEDRQEFVFYSLCPVTVPEPQRLAMAEFLTRANYGITLGNFEMDFDSGEIHYKTSIDVEGDQLSEALVQQLVYANVMMMDHYLPGILAVIYGNRTPVEAIAQIEEKKTEQND